MKFQPISPENELSNQSNIVKTIYTANILQSQNQPNAVP
jgi:hypothetical protein